MASTKLILSAHIRQSLAGDEAVREAARLLRCAADLIERGATLRRIDEGMLDEQFTATGAVDPRWKGKFVLERDDR